MTCNQRSTGHSMQARGGFLSSFLSQSKKGPFKTTPTTGASSAQTGVMLLSKKEPSNHQTPKAKEGATSCKESKSIFSSLGSTESSSLQQRQRHLQDHGKERKELLSKTTSQDTR